MPLLAPLVLDDPDLPKELVLRQIFTALTCNDVSVYVAMLLNDDDTKVLGLGLASALPNQPFIFIVQAHILPEATGGGEMLWETLVRWCRSVNRNEIRCFTKRDTEAMTRRSGFRVISTLMGYTLDGTAKDLFLNKSQGDTNGQRRNGRDQRSSRITKEHVSPLVPIPQRAGPGSTRPGTSEPRKLRPIQQPPVVSGGDSLRVVSVGGGRVDGSGERLDPRRGDVPDNSGEYTRTSEWSVGGTSGGSGNGGRAATERAGTDVQRSADAGRDRTERTWDIHPGSEKRKHEPVASANAGPNAEPVRRTQSKDESTIPPELLGAINAGAAESLLHPALRPGPIKIGTD